MVRPRVTPPLRAFFRLSFTSVSSSSRFTRSSSFCLQSSSTFFSRSDSDACERLPSGGREEDFFVKVYLCLSSINSCLARCQARRLESFSRPNTRSSSFKFQTELWTTSTHWTETPPQVLLPAAASTAVRRSLLSFFSCVRWFLISCFLFISSSSLDCSRLASASTRFLPYLHCSASARRRLGCEEAGYKELKSKYDEMLSHLPVSVSTKSSNQIRITNSALDYNIDTHL